MDIEELVAEQTQIDPTFKTLRCYLKVTAHWVWEQLQIQKGYSTVDFCLKTVHTILNRLNYSLKKVLKCKPLKKIAQTDAIFDNVAQRHQMAKADRGILRISIDTKAVVKIGELSRSGYNRLQTALKTTDHDQHWDATLVPFGVYEITTETVSVYFGNSIATAHFIVDCLEQWAADRKAVLADYHTLLIDLDNGKANASNSGFFMERMRDFAKKINKHIQLVYYPPYHSKYNPIERFWAVVEKYWAACVLDSVENTLKIAQKIKYKTKNIAVKLINKCYQKTKAFDKKKMETYTAIH